jgi:hypothetical protein
MADDNTCAHDGCSCSTTENSSYCSPQCETADNAGATTIACECGHGNCAGEINTETQFA